MAIASPHSLQAPTLEDLRAFADQYEFLSEPATRAYLDAAFDRLLYTYKLLSALRLDHPKVLEIGARPYFMTAMMKKHLGYEITAVDELLPGQPAQGTRVLRNLHNGDSLDIPFVTANIEHEALPFPAESFDIVIMSEVIEHLTHDPTWALVEIHRVLKAGGYFVLSTPNALRWEYLRRMVLGKNYYPPYSGYGTNARHNREFSIAELRELLTGCGFDIERIEAVRDAAYDHPRSWDRVVTLLNKLGRCRGRLDVIHLVARRTGEARYCYPEQLYYDLQGYRRVVDPYVKMGVNDQLQIDHAGFYAVEDWPPKIRWSKQSALLFLQGDGQKALTVRFFSGRRKSPTRASLSVDGEVIGSVECEPDRWYEQDFPLPRAAHGETRVLVSVAETWVPDEGMRNNDRRQLGLAIEYVQLL